MRTSISAAAILLVFSALFCSATTRYVSLTSPNSTPPYTNWDTAAHVIQDAIDAADPGDIVIVTNGLYNTGGHPVIETITNRVAITKPLTLQSVNGPAVTTIEGYQVSGTTNGPGAVRCVYMTNNTTLIGFTITHGATYTNADSFFDECIAGVWCTSFTNSVLSNCVIIANSAFNQVGGILLGTLNHCVITGNSDSSAVGGAAYSILNHCMVTNNYSASGVGGIYGNTGTSAPPNGDAPTSADYCTIAGNSTATGSGGAFSTFLDNCLIIGNQGAAARGCRLYNCTVVSNSIGVDHSVSLNSIIYYNSTNFLPIDSFQRHLCTTPISPAGLDIITNEPLFVDPAQGDFRLQPNSPCINSGDNDYLTVTNNLDFPDKFVFTILTQDFDGNPRVAGSTVDIGAYEFQGNVRYVNVGSTNPVPPYSDWSTAATNIQDAIDAANPGDTVLVTNGWYKTGGRVVYGALTNRIAITKSLTVQSVNGPDVTTIEGYQLPGITNGTGAVRCVYMTNNTALIGFTITHGATDTNYGTSGYDVISAGVWCANYTNCAVSNCVIIANSAAESAGGVAFGILSHCVIAYNSDKFLAGGAADSRLDHCLIASNYSALGAGGLAGISNPSPGFTATWANECVIVGNIGTNGYGAARGGFLNNCLIFGNPVLGASSCWLNNCTVVSNAVGTQNCPTKNCIIYYNDNGNCLPVNMYAANLCSSQFPAFGLGNITNEPLFVDPAHGDFRLQPNSPCINAGDNDYLTVTNNFWDTPDKFYFTFLTADLDNNPRVVGGTVDIGAYEFQSPASKISYTWLLQHSLPLNGSADNTDPDGDGMNNYQEWRAGTDPTNNKSLLQMLPLSLSVSGATLTWQSQTNINYYVQRATGLSAPFSTIQSNIVGQSGTTSYTDTNSVSNASFFYRVGVQ